MLAAITTHAWNVIFPPWGYRYGGNTRFNDTLNNFIGMVTHLSGYRNGAYVMPPENYPSNGDVLRLDVR